MSQHDDTPPAPAAQPMTWAELAAQMQRHHRDGAAAVRMAESRGLDPATYSGAVFKAPDNSGHRAPILFFGDWDTGGIYYVANPDGVWCYTPVPRGEGPAICWPGLRGPNPQRAKAQ